MFTPFADKLILIQLLYYSDETVEVGGRLYEIDTEGVATAASGSTAASPTEDPASASSDSDATESAPSLPSTSESTPAATATTADSSSSDSHSNRAPSIQFLGKDGWAMRKSGQEQHSSPQPPAPTKPHAVTIIQDDAVRHPMYGRPPFSEDEMEALICGGANLVADWKVKN
jgi:pyruvate/2-oxoglutarate dehydrogenase complex dihydrolipoamide acyltransferase (E2) component